MSGRSLFQRRCDAAWRENRYYAYTVSNAVLNGIDGLASGGRTNLYIVHDLASSAIKIGVAVQPVDRLRQLQIGNVRKLELVDWAPATARLEEFFHRLLDSHRIRGEWFRPHHEVLVVCELIMSGGDLRRQYEEQGERADPEDTLWMIAAEAEEAHQRSAAA